MINGIAKETAKTDNDIISPCARTAGNISSDDFVCCSVANRSVWREKKRQKGVKKEDIE